MAGSSKIRWRKTDAERLGRDVKIFNAKLSRILKQDPTAISYLPARQSVRAIKAQIKAGELGRKDINLELRGMERFSRKGAEAAVRSATGLQITKWQKKEIQIKVNIINARRLRERAVVENWRTTTPKGYQDTRIPTNLKALAPKKFNLDEIQPGQEWQMYVQSVEKQAKADYKAQAEADYKQKYLKAIILHLGDAGKDLYDYVKALSDSDVTKGFYDDPLMNIQYTTDPLAKEIITETALERWVEFAPLPDELLISTPTDQWEALKREAAED